MGQIHGRASANAKLQRGRSRRVLLVVVLAALTAAPIAHLQAPAAKADIPAVTNVIPTTETGDPVDTSFPLSHNENLWAYVTAPLGGAICVHEPGPAPGDPLDCPGDGWGTGFAPPFFAGFVPVAPAPLRSGTFVLMATSNDDVGNPFVAAVSQPFTIVHCNGCPISPPPDPNLAKAVMNAIAASITRSCQLAATLNFTHRLLELKNDYDTMVVAPGGGGLGMFITKVAFDEAADLTLDGVGKPVAFLPAKIGVGLWALCKSFLGADFPDYPIPFVNGPATHVPGLLEGVNAWLNDPPQPYETIAVANPIDWTQFDVSGWHPDALDLAVPVDEFRAYLAAGTTSFERFTMALGDGAAAQGFAHDQALAIAVNFDGVRDALIDTSRQIDAVVEEILADPQWVDAITQAEIDEIGPVLRRIRDTGFTAQEIADFQAAGLSDGVIHQLRDQLGSDTNTITAGMSFHSVFTQLADNMDTAVPAIDDFATQAAVYAADIAAPNAAPVPSFTATPQSGAAPLNVAFDAAASTDPNGDALSYSWTFGDGGTGSGSSPSHPYNGAGSYTATVTVSDGKLAASTSQLITVTGNRAPIANRDGDFTYPNVPVSTRVLSNDFDADSDPLTITGWTQGTGGTVSCAGPSCTYTPGNVVGTDIYHYTISDGQGGVATGTVAITISAGGNPIVDFTATPQSGPGPLTTTLDGTVSSDPGGSVVAWAWDLGDGTTATGPIVVHTYPVGTYDVRLQVTDNLGNTSSQGSRIVTATQAANAVPFVRVTASPEEGAASLQSYLSVSTYDPDGAVVLIEWDFDDGTTASGTRQQVGNVNHTWTVPGDYDVTVTATDDDGGSATATVTIHVFAPANQPPAMADEILAVLKGESIQVDALVNEIDPDGDALEIVDVRGPFFGTGGCTPDGLCDYTASLTTTQQDRIYYTVSDGHGHLRVAQVIIDVSKLPGAPTAVLALQPFDGLTPLISYLDATGSTDGQGGIVAYEWTVDDVVVSNQAVLNHVFDSPGFVRVVLAVTDEDGLMDWAEKTIQVADRHNLSLPWCGDQDDGTLAAKCLEYQLDQSIQFYQVDGQGPGSLTFDYVLRGGGLGNELVIFRVDDPLGRINGHEPASPEWYDDVLGRAQTIFPSYSTAAFPDVEVPVQGGDIYGFILLPTSTLEGARSTPGWENSAFFSLDAINTDGTDHFIGFQHQDGELFEFALEDLQFGGDHDYDDVVYTVSGQLAPLSSVAVTKTVEDPVAAAGAFDLYTISVSNTNAFPVVVDAVVDQLPDGFAYVAGSTTGALTDDPDVAGSGLTWSGPFTVQPLDSVTISFGVTVADQPGTYFNEASVAAGDIHVEPTGPTAPILVVAPLPDDLAPLVDAGPGGAGDVATPVALDGTVIEPPGESHDTSWTYAPLNGVDPGAVCLFGNPGATDTSVSCTHSGSYTMTLTADDAGTPIADSTIVRIYAGPDETVLSLDALPDREVDEGQVVSLIAAAHAPGGASITYSLGACPAGASIDPGTGAFAWQTGEADGPGNTTCTVHVATADDDVSDTFAIVVNEVNLDPTLTPPSDVTVEAGETATGQSSASDPDLPANTLTYSLVASPGSIGPSSGSFSWATTLADIGDHTIAVHLSDGVGGSDDGTFEVHVTAPVLPTSLQLGGDTSGQYSDAATVTARLTADGSAVPGASVELSLGAASATADTDLQGWATATFTIPGPAGSIARGASFAGDATHESSAATGTFNVLREDASLELPGGDAVAAGTTVQLRVTVRDSAALGYSGLSPETGATGTIGDITRMRVLFEVYAASTCLTGSPLRTFTANVVDEGTAGDGIGAAGASWTNVPEGSYCISARLIGATATVANDWYVAAPPQPMGLGVFRPATGHVTGGGWIALASGERLNFGFNAIADKKGAKGQLMLVFRMDCGNEPSRLLVKSNAFSSLSTDGLTDPATAVLTGKAVLRCIALDDGAVLWEGGGATWRATVIDGGVRAADAFGIRVTNSAGQVVLDLTPVVLRSGSIVAHLQ